MSDGYVINLSCTSSDCNQKFEKKDYYVCDFCFAPLEVRYDYEKIKKDLSIKKIESRKISENNYH